MSDKIGIDLDGRGVVWLDPYPVTMTNGTSLDVKVVDAAGSSVELHLTSGLADLLADMFRRYS